MNNAKITYTLEMHHPQDLCPKSIEKPGLRIERMATPCPEFNKFLHTVIGHAYRWGGRQDWTQEDWIAYASRDDLETWVAYVEGTPAGYVEMQKTPEGDVHIWNFGLLPQFVGQGLGGHLLTHAVKHAWAPIESGGMGATRVWLRTCSHDHPHALKNYLARGFKIAKTEQSAPNPPIKSFWALMLGSE
jgi:ribosomal protein S18 acetylase RimI-like enzyme